MTGIQSISADYLRQYIERIENLEEEKRDLTADIRDVYAEAKANGFDPKIMRLIVAMRKVKKEEREALENVTDLYKHALGMLPDDSQEPRVAAITTATPTPPEPAQTQYGDPQY